MRQRKVSEVEEVVNTSNAVVGYESGNSTVSGSLISVN